MYEELKVYYDTIKNFHLEIPERFSFPLDVFDRWGKKLALIWTDGNELKKFTFEDLTIFSSKLAGGLKKLGINKGDKVLIYLPNRYEWWICVLA